MTPPDEKQVVEERKELIKEVLKAYPEKAAKKA
jgi:nitrogenase molybdenum-iron protein alpha chain